MNSLFIVSALSMVLASGAQRIPVVVGPVQPVPGPAVEPQQAGFAPPSIGSGVAPNQNQPSLAFRPDGPVQFFPPNNNQNNLACGFSCSRRTTLLTNIDGTFSSAACSDRNADPRVRCSACCGSYALANGLQTTWSAGFPSNNGQDCICCINNQRC